MKVPGTERLNSWLQYRGEDGKSATRLNRIGVTVAAGAVVTTGIGVPAAELIPRAVHGIQGVVDPSRNDLQWKVGSLQVTDPNEGVRTEHALVRELMRGILGEPNDPALWSPATPDPATTFFVELAGASEPDRLSAQGALMDLGIGIQIVPSSPTSRPVQSVTLDDAGLSRILTAFSTKGLDVSSEGALEEQAALRGQALPSPPSERAAWLRARFQGNEILQRLPESLTPAQTVALELLKGSDAASLNGLRDQLGVAIPEGPLSTQHAELGNALLDGGLIDGYVAQLGKAGLEPTPEGLSRAAKLRKQKLPEGTAAQAAWIAERLKGNEVLYDVSGDLSSKQTRALEELRDKPASKLLKLREKLGVPSPDNALGQWEQLLPGNVTVTKAFLNEYYEQVLKKRTDPDVTRVAMDWAKNLRVNHNTGKRDWVDYCLAFVARAVAASGHGDAVPGGTSAKVSYNKAVAAGLTRTDWKNFRGNAVLYWDVRTNGHIAIATDKIGPDGKPMILHTGSVLWGEYPGAKLWTWTETVNNPWMGHPTAYVPVMDDGKTVG